MEASRAGSTLLVVTRAASKGLGARTLEIPRMTSWPPHHIVAAAGFLSLGNPLSLARWETSLYGIVRFKTAASNVRQSTLDSNSRKAEIETALREDGWEGTGWSDALSQWLCWTTTMNDSEPVPGFLSSGYCCNSPSTVSSPLVLSPMCF